MPLYEFACPACDTVTEALRRMTAPPIACPRCGAPTYRMISKPAPVAPDITPYYDNGLGSVVRTRAHRKQLVRAHGLVEAG